MVTLRTRKARTDPQNRRRSEKDSSANTEEDPEDDPEDPGDDPDVPNGDPDDPDDDPDDPDPSSASGSFLLQLPRTCPALGNVWEMFRKCSGNV